MPQVNYGDGLYGNGLYGGTYPSISATFNNSILSPGYNITINDMIVGGAIAYFRIIARDPEGTYSDYVVRGTDMVEPDALVAVTDYEFPQFRSIEYILELYDASLNLIEDYTTGVVSGEPEAYFVSQGSYPLYNSWLHSVNQPALNLPVFIKEWKQWKRDGRLLAKMNVLGRENAVVVTDVYSGREGQFSFWVGDVLPDGETAPYYLYELLITKGDILMFRSFDEKFTGVRRLYMAIDNFEILKTSQHNQGRIHNGEIVGQKGGIWEFRMTFVEVDRPATGTEVVGGEVWQSVNDTFSSWQDVLDNRATWLEVLQDPTL